MTQLFKITHMNTRASVYWSHGFDHLNNDIYFVELTLVLGLSKSSTGAAVLPASELLHAAAIDCISRGWAGQDAQ